MPTKTEILTSLQFPLFNTLDPVNTTGSARFTITYEYAGTSEPADLPTSSTYTGWRDFTTAEKAAFRAALDHIETFLNVSFVEVSGDSDPDINVGAVDIPGSTIGWGGYSASYFGSSFSEWDGYVVYDNTLDLSAEAQVNLLLHEMGHAMGLRHPFGSDSPLPSEFENNRYTIMSYTDNPDNGLRSDAVMLYDVFALQDIWGEAEFNEGRNVYTGARTDTVDVIWDTGGRDKLDASDRFSAVTLDLRAGKFSTFDALHDVVIAFGTRIEIAAGGSGGDTIIGNAKNNKLTGNDGVDSLRGLGGDDTLLGGSGNDSLLGNSGRDVLVGGSGDDTIQGGQGRDVIKGMTGTDTLLGNAGRDKFVYKSGHGTDRIGDFQDDTDTLRIIGYGDADAVLAKATEVAGDVVFDFGLGNVLTVADITIAALSDDLIA